MNEVIEVLCVSVSASLLMPQSMQLNNSSHDSSGRTRHLLSDAEKVNEYFAGISFRQFYNAQNVTNFQSTSPGDCHDYRPIYTYDVEYMLRKVSTTAPGPDNLPYWIFKYCSHDLAKVIAHTSALCALVSFPTNCLLLSFILSTASTYQSMPAIRLFLMFDLWRVTSCVNN
jgi:hypothetical protein